MDFKLTKPCKDCPFRHDREPFLTPDRAEEITDSVLRDESFPCHKTLDYSGGNGGEETSKTQMCAGAMIFLEKNNAPNQMMRIGERLGMYDHRKLDMSAPVYDEQYDMIQHCEDAKEKRIKK